MKSDYFRDKFKVSLKIQYGCQLVNVSSCGREGVNRVPEECKMFVLDKSSLTAYAHVLYIYMLLCGKPLKTIMNC